MGSIKEAGLVLSDEQTDNFGPEQMTDAINQMHI